MEDPELTGEFVQCLRILGISHVDTTIWPLIERVLSGFDTDSVSLMMVTSARVHSFVLGPNLPAETRATAWWSWKLV